MTQLETPELGTLEVPIPIPSLPFAQTIDVSGRTARPDEPSPCLPSAASVWYALPPGLIGALVGSGIPEERVKHYESGIKKGGIVMGVTPRSDEDAEYLEREWIKSRGEHIYR